MKCPYLYRARIEMPRLFLTGGGGMVGRNIRAHKYALHWDILAPTSAELDLTDANAVRSYFVVHKPDLVVHAAGRVIYAR